MPLLRKIIFYIFVLIYLVICPMLILRMVGFVKDPISHRWVKTGIIYVSSNPPNARVSLNGIRVLETTPTIIRDLTRGPYTVRMKLDGYQAWENTVPVAENKATSVENVLLIPKQWKTKALSNLPFTNLHPFPGNNYLLASSDDTVQSIVILRLNKIIEDSLETKASAQELASLFPEESIYREAKVMKYFTIERSPFFIMEISLGDRHKYLWIDPREKQVHIEDISDLLPEPPVTLSWEPNEERNIFVFLPNAINRINIKEKVIHPNIDANELPEFKKSVDLLTPSGTSQAFLINNENTLLFRKGNAVFLMDEEPFKEPRLIEILRVQTGSDIFFAERTGKMYFIDQKTNLLSSLQIMHHKPFIPKPIAETLRLKRPED